MKTIILNILAFIAAVYGMVITTIGFALYMIVSLPIFLFQMTKAYKMPWNKKWSITNYIIHITDKVEELI